MRLKSSLEPKHGFDTKKRDSRSPGKLLGNSAKWWFVVSESQLVISLLIQLILDVFAWQLRTAMTSFMFVCPSIHPSDRMDNPRPTGRIFVKFYTGNLYIYIYIYIYITVFVTTVSGYYVCWRSHGYCGCPNYQGRGCSYDYFVIKFNSVAITSIPTITLTDKVTNLGR